MEQIDIAYNQEELDAKETLWISELKATNPNEGYNMTEGGLGGRPTVGVREKLRLIGKEIKFREINIHFTLRNFKSNLTIFLNRTLEYLRLNT